jgi:hypothetical protein
MAKILIKRSSAQGSQPTAQVLSIGELALNTADKKIFFKHTDDSIQYLQAIYESSISELADVDYGSSIPTDGDVLKWDGISLKWVPVTPEPPLTVINTDQLGDPSTTVQAVENLKFDYEFTVTDGQDGSATVQYSGAFKSISVTDQDTLTALNDTALKVEAGTNVDIGTDQQTQTLTIGVAVTPSFDTVTINQDGYIVFPDGTRQFTKPPRIYTNADALQGIQWSSQGEDDGVSWFFVDTVATSANLPVDYQGATGDVILVQDTNEVYMWVGITLDDLLPGDYYYDDSTESIYIMIDTGLGYNQLLDLTVRA